MASTASSSSSSSAGAAIATGGKKKKKSKKRKSVGSAQAHVDMSLEEAEHVADAMESRAISDDWKAKYATMVRAPLLPSPHPAHCIDVFVLSYFYILLRRWRTWHRFRYKLKNWTGNSQTVQPKIGLRF